MPQKKLIDQIHIQERFQRSVCIDSDSKNLGAALENYYCPESIKDILKNIAKSSSDGGNSVFSWTGPYGIGKSSASLLLAALACGNKSDLAIAKSAWGDSRSFNAIIKRLRLNDKPRLLIPVVGSRKNPLDAIAETLIQCTRIRKSSKTLASTPETLINAIKQTAESRNNAKHGVLLLIDEMGKFLEYAALGNSDIYFWQLLAEAITRSQGKIIMVGMLHQSFSAYANSLSKETHKEWNKVQGRFADQLISISTFEQINFISKALKNPEPVYSARMKSALDFIVCQICPHAPSEEKSKVAKLLEKCIPLHPAVVLLLSTFLKTSFVQTQRSLFSFLNSHEPFGFIEFLEDSPPGKYFSVEKFWDYLENNLKHVILESPNSHIWIQASDSIMRAGRLQNSTAERIAKIIGAFALLPTPNTTLNQKMLYHCLTDINLEKVKETCKQLEEKSIIVYRKHRSAYAPYGGSDFDIESATQKAQEQIGKISFQKLTEAVEVPPAIARRFSYKTGSSMRLTVLLTPFEQIQQCLSAGIDEKMAGLAVIALTDSTKRPRRFDLNNLLTLEDGRPVIISFSQNPDIYLSLKKLIALRQVAKEQALENDLTARKEVEMRISIVSSQTNAAIQKLLSDSKWHWQKNQKILSDAGSLSTVSSKVLENFYKNCPYIHSELINVDKLSGSASSAMRNLMRKMLTAQGEPRLGIEGYPAHGGLFDSVLEKTCLYQTIKNKPGFHAPSAKNGNANLSELWKKTNQYLKSRKSKVNVEKIYEIWRSPPFGIKHGIMPILLLTYILTKKEHIAVYVDGFFKPQLEEIDIEQMSLRANRIELFYMNPTPSQTKLFSDLIRLYAMEGKPSLLNLAKHLVSKTLNLPNWTQCTNLLPAEIRTFREVIYRAQDPIKLIYEDLPASLNTSKKSPSKTVNQLKKYISVLEKFLPDKLAEMRQNTLSRLKTSPGESRLLKDRASLVKENTGDLRLKAFAQYLEKDPRNDDVMMQIASLAANKPIKDWSDQHYQTAQIELNMLTSLFEHTELYANKETLPGHFILSVGTQVNGELKPQLCDVFISKKYHALIADSADAIQEQLSKWDDPKTKLAVIAKAAEHIMQTIEKDDS